MFLLNQTPSALYAAFDVFPAPKGAAIHIQHMASTLFKHEQPGCLYVLGSEQHPVYQLEDNIEIVRFKKSIDNYLHRAIEFSQSLQQLLTDHGKQLRICHFRDPWGGFPIIEQRIKQTKNMITVYEVNALPSIELPYAYPHIAASTLEKIASQEDLCLEYSDAIITPSQTTKVLLMNKGINAEKIQVIRNGATFSKQCVRPQQAPEKYLIYFGAVQRWQGLDDLLRAFALLLDLTDLHLVLCISRHNHFAKQYRKLADKLGISERIIWLYGLPQEKVLDWLRYAILSIAPLTNCSRNVLQGCCPLKILESMAAGVPVIASDLPVVRELMVDHEHGRLVRPGRPDDLSRVIRCLLDYPDVIKTMGIKAAEHAHRHFTWEQSTTQLSALYQRLLIMSKTTQKK